eukprot:TRINITY_DN129_c1_g1_i2.p1 TRINITY_DN129_c1_g1~~TRINITY_DN129_c1_g1_i2.p1  ORF type:complete len:450 (-),score=200.58 TRINITY_DN129_c1_g1_i2:34-1383(-)
MALSRKIIFFCLIINYLFNFLNANKETNDNQLNDLLPYSFNSWTTQIQDQSQLIEIINKAEIKTLLKRDSEPSTPFEVYPIYKNESISNIAYIEHSRFANTKLSETSLGHVFYLQNAHRHFSYLPPNGGCGGNRKKTTETAKVGKCRVATNAGFFNTRNGDCIGNLISNSQIVQKPNYKNANFGILVNGSFVIGYPTNELLESGEITQLVAGVIWLVRNGKNYVATSAEIEDLSKQETGQSFVTITSARGAIGHDANGRLMLVTVDGKSYQRGTDLSNFADLLIRLGAINAINLDGGGSLTTVEENLLVNYPSDECTSNRLLTCERAITSITCIHDDIDDNESSTLTATENPTTNPTSTLTTTSNPTSNPTTTTTISASGSINPSAKPSASTNPTNDTYIYEMDLFWQLVISAILVVVFVNLIISIILATCTWKNANRTMQPLHMDDQL